MTDAMRTSAAKTQGGTMIRFIFSKKRPPYYPYQLGRRYTYEGGYFAIGRFQVFIGRPKTWPTYTDLIETHDDLVRATEAGL